MPQKQIVVKENIEDNNQITSKVVNGSLWNITGQVGVMIASLIATSFVIRLLGTELYGAWALITLTIGYATQSDLGMGTASTRFGSEAFAQGDREKENKIIWTALLIAIIPSLIISVLVAVFAQKIVVGLLKIPEHLQPQVIFALILVSFCFSFRVASNVFNTPQIVRLRIDINASIVSGLVILQVLITPLAIWIWGGLIPAAATVNIFGFLTLFLIFLASRRLLKNLNRPRFDTNLIKPLLSFGGPLVLASLVGIILGTIEKPILARYSSVTALAHYAVASTLANVMSMFPIAISQSLLPAFTRLYTSQNSTALSALFDRAVKGNLLWSLPMAYFLCVIAKPFFTIWAGEEFGREATVPLYIMVVGLVVNVFAYIPYTLLQAAGKTKVILRMYIVEIVPYIITAAIFASLYGANGAASAWSLRILIDAIILFICVKPLLGSVIGSFLKIGVWYWSSFIIMIVASILLINFVSSYLLLTICSVILLTLYLIIVVNKVLSEEERLWFFRKVDSIQTLIKEKISG